MNILKLLLLPFAFIYGFITSFRNFFYNVGIFKSYAFDIPIISIGNLCMGGTGKTPHCEFLIQNLYKQYNLVYLSRGYRRKSRGLQIIKIDDNSQKAGDEPLQIKRKFPHIVVAVSRNRVKGIQEILNNFPQTQIIILDDAFQHRSVRPAINILLTNFFHLYTKDNLFPIGSLRESRRGYKRADLIIVTKTAKIFPMMLKNIVEHEIKPLPYQKLFFTYYKYSNFLPAISNNIYKKNPKTSRILLFTGIADANPLVDHLKLNNYRVEHISFPDHHIYSKNDIIRIIKTFENMIGTNKIILTTEKDLMRIRGNQEIEGILNQYPLYYILINVKFHFDEEQKFLSLISKMIDTNLPLRQKDIEF